MSTFAERLEKLLEQRGWSQERLARELGISSKTVWRYANGTKPSRANLAQLAEEFGVTEAWLEYGAQEGAGGETERVELDDAYESSPGDLDTVFRAFPGLDENSRASLRRQRWDGGPPGPAELMARAQSLLAMQRGKAVPDRTPEYDVELPANLGTLAPVKRTGRD